MKSMYVKFLTFLYFSLFLVVVDHVCTHDNRMMQCKPTQSSGAGYKYKLY